MYRVGGKWCFVFLCVCVCGKPALTDYLLFFFIIGSIYVISIDTVIIQLLLTNTFLIN